MFVFTLSDIFKVGIWVLFLAVMLVCLLVAVIDVKTKDWRYEHFKCPNCSKRNPETNLCGHFRNSGCDCDYFTKNRRNK